MTNRVSPAAVKAMLKDGGELALLDVREEGTHSAAHPLYAAALPLSRLELLAEAMLPRKSVRIVLIDDDDGLAERAASKLAGYGYSDVSILDGGVPGWRDAGYVLFSGVHVPSKAFGEYVEHHYGTPHISADDLKSRMDAGENLIVLDSRPLDEYRVMNIPTGIDVPGAELAYRVHDVTPSDDALVVVNCAGRTRSIIGAQSLINAGVPNKVVALKDGTMGWHLAGYTLEHGQSRLAPEVSADGLTQARAAAAHVQDRFGVQVIDRDTLAQWQGEANSRSLHLLDVRTVEEYEAGHLPGSQHAPGGQLVQETETWVPTLGARIVLVDDTGVRATLTASWLVQMGWDVAVLENGLDGAALATGPQPSPAADIAAAARAEMSPADLKAALDAGTAVVVDLALSRTYKAGHIPGAWFAIRARLPQSLPKLPAAQKLVFTSPDGVIARLAAPEASELTDREVMVLAGGTDAWVAAGLPLANGFENMADARDDVWLKPYDHEGPVEQHMRDYLTWEIDLINEIERDGDHRFRLFPA